MGGTSTTGRSLDVGDCTGIAVASARGMRSVLVLGAESLLEAVLLIAWRSLSSRGRAADRQQVEQNDAKYLLFFGTAIVLMPWCWQIVTRMFEEGTGLELVALSSFAWATLLSAWAARKRQAFGTVVICSGFSTLVLPVHPIMRQRC